MQFQVNKYSTELYCNDCIIALTREDLTNNPGVVVNSLNSPKKSPNLKNYNRPTQVEIARAKQDLYNAYKNCMKKADEKEISLPIRGRGHFHNDMVLSETDLARVALKAIINNLQHNIHVKKVNLYCPSSDEYEEMPNDEKMYRTCQNLFDSVVKNGKI